MDLIVGKTYKSSRHGRNIRIRSVDYDSLFDKLTLEITWVDKDDPEDIEHDTLQVYVSETHDWVEVRS